MKTVILFTVMCFSPVEQKNCIGIAVAPFKTIAACQAGAWDAILGTVRAIPKKPDAISYSCIEKGDNA